MFLNCFGLYYCRDLGSKLTEYSHDFFFLFCPFILSIYADSFAYRELVGASDADAGIGEWHRMSKVPIYDLSPLDAQVWKNKSVMKAAELTNLLKRNHGRNSHQNSGNGGNGYRQKNSGQGRFNGSSAKKQKTQHQAENGNSNAAKNMWFNN